MMLSGVPRNEGLNIVLVGGVICCNPTLPTSFQNGAHAIYQKKGQRSKHDNWASEASPTLGCSIEISRDIYMCVGRYVCRMSN